jgi:2-amino-4-hydroxy-6-hydroxymethyldihydropteridine diphosphokinase
MKHQAYILLGSNQGNREGFLEQAAELVAVQAGSVAKRSSIYETAAWGKEDQPSFLNQVLLIETSLNPDNLMQTLLNIESQLGRVRIEKMGQRTIDLDILLYDDRAYVSSLVTIPHPALQDRKFVLMPLAEIASAVIHPVFQQTVSSLLDQCADPLPVQIRETEKR